MPVLLLVIILGIVEGITEYLPVSSTGHLILATELLGFNADRWALFNVAIQPGAILAIIVLYWRTFWTVITGLLGWEQGSVRFTRNVLVAFVPAVIVGLALNDVVDAMLGSAVIVAWALIIGGVAILLVERFARPIHVGGISNVSLKQAIAVGLVQCLAMVPGVSRSGATILGAMSFGVDRRTAAEFSFFLAVPTMLGASTLTLLKHHDQLGAVSFGGIALGFVVSFLVAVVVIRWFIGIVSRRGFAPFAWYRIAVGAAALAWLTLR